VTKIDNPTKLTDTRHYILPLAELSLGGAEFYQRDALSCGVFLSIPEWEFLDKPITLNVVVTPA
jgi:hypothetical protein